MKRLWRRLSSPRTAVWLIVALCVYSAVATSVPQRSADAAEYARWISSGGGIARFADALGLSHAFSTPAFYLLVIVLFMSTVSCAISRTRLAVRHYRERGILTGTTIRRLEEHADFAVELPGDRDQALATVARSLRKAGLRTRIGPKAGYAESGALGLFGSPVFHWSLAAIIVVAALGQLTRWEGLIAVPQQSGAVDDARLYGTLDAGALPMPHTGWALKLVSVDEDLKVDGVEYGWTPTIAVVDHHGRTAVQRVHANRPLRRGPLLVHSSDKGLSAVLELADGSGADIASTTAIFDFDDTTASGTTTATVTITSAGQPVDVALSLIARDRRGNLPRLKPPVPTARIHLPNGQGDATLKVGESMRLSQGSSIRLASVGYYARLTVVRDWSVAWLYALMGLATVAMTLTLLFPFRSVWLLAREGKEQTTLTFVVRESKRDGSFRMLVEQAVRPAENLSE